MNKVVESYLRNFTKEDVTGIFSRSEMQYIFDVLSSKEEKANGIRDQWGNWEFGFSSLDFTSPFLDNFVKKRLNEKKVDIQTIWPDNKKFAILISHDVDLVSNNDFMDFSRKIISLIYLKASVKEICYTIFSFLISLKYIFKKDKLWHYEKWIHTIQKYKFTSTFFFFSKLALKFQHTFDCSFSFSDKVIFNGVKMNVRGMILEIEKLGFEIGVHLPINSFDNTTHTKFSLQQLKEVVKEKIIASRQHFLHFCPNQTPKVLFESGIKIDSTLGYNRNIGFRNGTSFPFLLSNEFGEAINIIEMPMHIMDVALFNNNALELNKDLAKIKCLKILEAVENVGGCLCINFHPNYLNNQMWFDVFEFILKEASLRGAYCADYKQIVTIFDKNAR
jgi:hypothetical protein